MPVITALLWQGGRPRQTIPRSWWAKQPGLHGGEQQKIRDEDSHRYYALTSIDIMACVCLLSWMLMHIINTHKHICIHTQKEAIFLRSERWNSADIHLTTFRSAQPFLLLRGGSNICRRSFVTLFITCLNSRVCVLTTCFEKLVVSYRLKGRQLKTDLALGLQGFLLVYPMLTWWPLTFLSEKEK